MALAYYGLNWSQERIASQIGHIAGAGTPARHVTRLTAPGIKISYLTSGSLEDVQACLDRAEVPVVFVRTSELPYWEEDTAHTVLAVGLNADFILVHDPAFEQAPIPIRLMISCWPGMSWGTPGPSLHANSCTNGNAPR